MGRHDRNQGGKNEKRTLSTVFDEFEAPQVEETNENGTEETAPEVQDVPATQPEQPEQPDVTETTPTEETAEANPTATTMKDVSTNLILMYNEKSKKKTVEETHNRATFLFRKDLQDRLDKLSAGRRGFKTMFMNKAIEALLDSTEAELEVESLKKGKKHRNK